MSAVGAGVAEGAGVSLGPIVAVGMGAVAVTWGDGMGVDVCSCCTTGDATAGGWGVRTTSVDRLVHAVASANNAAVSRQLMWRLFILAMRIVVSCFTLKRSSA